MRPTSSGFARRLLPEFALALVLLLAPLIAPLAGFTADLLSRILVWGLFGIGFDILFGYTGLLSFGQAAVFGVGGFATAYLLTNGLIGSVLLALLLGTLAAAVAGVLIGLLALRRTGIYFAMITLAFAEMFFFIENSPLADYTGGENGLPGVPSPRFALGGFALDIRSGWTMYGFLAVCFFLGYLLARRVVASPVGRVLIAIRDNPLRARALGHAIGAYKLAAFTLAAAYAGLAGGLFGVMQGYMPPEAFTFDTSGQLVMQTVIGGAGSLIGPLVGAAIWLWLRDVLQNTLGLGPAWKLVLGLVFVLLVTFLRHGVVGGVQFAWRRLRPPPEPHATVAGAAPRARAAVVELHAPVRHPLRESGPALEVTGLSKRYGGLLANSDIAFTVERGELRGVIGPNGAGKSTFFKMLTGEVRPSAGQILFNGQDITGHGVTEVCQRGLSKSYQINQLFGRLTVRQNLEIAVLAERRGRFRLDLWRPAATVPGAAARVEQVLALVDLAGRADLPVSVLAYGEKRRLEIGLALATAPSMLLLDEPLAGMSPQERVETVKLLRQIGRDRTLVVVEHDMDAMFELAGRITVLCEGRVLAEGTPAEIQQSRAVQEAYLGGVHAA
jgi:branched-chain amino acid transport system permease protein